jgi:hypothetical protein
MSTISTFTPLIYTRPSSHAETVLSTLSRYFYLGGDRANVIKNDEVQLEIGKISSCNIALKIASYVLLFPFTLTLLVINFCLRYQHNFTVISSSELNYCSIRAPAPSNKKAETCSLEELKKRLKQEEPIQDLFNSDSEPFKLTNELIDIIFEQCNKKNIIFYLNAALNHSFKLSDYDEIRKKIVEDKGHVLDNDSLIDLFKQHNLEADENKLNACYDLAYRLNHPYIYRLSLTPVLPIDYNLNFLWVNLNPQDRASDKAQNIFGDGLNLFENADCIKNPEELRFFENQKEPCLEDLEKIKKSFSYRISKWADVNPHAQINLWYDSALVTQQAQQKTFEMMSAISKSRSVNLKLRDIRQLSNITELIKTSLHPGTQVYYRVDILKALIADHMISSEESAKYCVVSDIDVAPMAPQQMFDQRTITYLSSIGYVFNRVSFLGNFENSFFIFNKESTTLKKNHYKNIIESTNYSIDDLRLYEKDAKIRPACLLDSQFVFKKYRLFRFDMNEPCSWDDSYALKVPRKVVKCPESQFNAGGKFSDFDHQTETFRFIGDDKVPYTKNGRNFGCSNEQQIPELIEWKADPLSLVE